MSFFNPQIYSAAQQFNPFQERNLYGYEQRSGLPTPFSQLPVDPNQALQVKQLLLSHLVDARRRDIFKHDILEQLANSVRFNRSSDWIIKSLAQGQQIPESEIVRSILSDRVKDDRVARIIHAIATEQKSNHKCDDVINAIATSQPIPFLQAFRQKDLERDETDRVLISEVQKLCCEDLQKERGLLSRSFGPLFGGSGVPSAVQMQCHPSEWNTFTCQTPFAPGYSGSFNGAELSKKWNQPVCKMNPYAGLNALEMLKGPIQCQPSAGGIRSSGLSGMEMMGYCL